MKIYMKETRNDAGEFYRRGDWGVERPDGWDNGRGNWTTTPPPEESMVEENPIPCDWDEDAQAWVIDANEKTLRDWQNEMAATDATMPRWAEDLWDVIGIEQAPEIVQNRHAAKKALRSQMPVGL